MMKLPSIRFTSNIILFVLYIEMLDKQHLASSFLLIHKYIYEHDLQIIFNTVQHKNSDIV